MKIDVNSHYYLIKMAYYVIFSILIISLFLISSLMSKAIVSKPIPPLINTMSEEGYKDLPA